MEALVSIVVPVYNVEKYLEKCLISLCRQTYKNIEIIVIDDGSTDRSQEIIKKYMKLDKRIICERQENAGLGAARNTGIKLSKGSYLCFVDSDDWVSEDYVEQFVKTLEEDNTDMVISNIKYVYEDGSERPRTPHIDYHEVISSKEAIKRLLINKQYRFHAPNKFVKKSIFQDNKIQFAEGKLYEDIFTTYKVILGTEKVSLIPNHTYFYLQSRAGSIMNAKINKKRFYDLYEALNQIVTNSQIKKMNLEKEIQVIYVLNVISLMNYVYPAINNLSKEEITEYRKYVLKDKNSDLLKNIFRNNEISAVQKLRVYLIRKHFWFYCKVMKIIKGV